MIDEDRPDFSQFTGTFQKPLIKSEFYGDEEKKQQHQRMEEEQLRQASQI